MDEGMTEWISKILDKIPSLGFRQILKDSQFQPQGLVWPPAKVPRGGSSSSVPPLSNLKPGAGTASNSGNSPTVHPGSLLWTPTPPLSSKLQKSYLSQELSTCYWELVASIYLETSWKRSSNLQGCRLRTWVFPISPGELSAPWP
jgi:hypothetical protein